MMVVCLCGQGAKSFTLTIRTPKRNSSGQPAALYEASQEKMSVINDLFECHANP